MKKTKLLLVLSALSLAGCDFISITDSNKTSNNVVDNQTSENTQNSQNNAGNTGENEGNTSANTGSNTETNTGSNTDSNTGSNTDSNTSSNTGSNTGSNTEDDYIPNMKPVDEIIPENTPYPLTDYTDFAFHDGHEPMYHKDWSFYYGTSLNPSGRLWKNPDEKSEASGINFVKNTYLVSPLLDSWTKIEIRFNFWFSSHTSSSYKATDGNPQFTLEAYDESGNKLSSQNILIKKSDIPNSGTAKWFTSYIRESSMKFFILRWGNYIANGNSGYSAIICDAKLKGWPYN